MARRKSAILLGLAGLLARVSADCTCAGTDYTHGGTYFIDENSDAYFKFSSIFEGESGLLVMYNSTGRCLC
jgi:hypothetical protein